MTTDDFELGPEIARGGMGVIYRARQISMDRTVAFKVLDENLAGNIGFVERFVREAQAAGRLGHPNVCTVYATGERDGHHFIAMEWLPDGTLEDQIKAGPIEPRAALAMMRQIASGLYAAHRAGLVHRDLKPANIMFRNDVPVITDFGIVLVTEATRLTEAGSIVGTPHYMSPEQVQSPQTIDARSDVYSLGILLYEMVTGKLPFVSDTPHAVLVAHLTTEMPQIDEPGMERINDLIQKMTVKDPAERLPSCNAVIEGIDNALSDQRAPNAKPKQGRSGGLRTAIVAIVLLAVAGIAYVMTRDASEPATSHAITLSITPKEASAEIVGVGKYKPGLALAPGAYQLRVTHPGFEPWKQEFIVTDQPLAIQASMTPLEPQQAPTPTEDTSVRGTLAAMAEEAPTIGLTVPKTVFLEDEIVLRLALPEPGDWHLNIINIDANDEAVVLFPNALYPRNKLQIDERGMVSLAETSWSAKDDGTIEIPTLPMRRSDFALYAGEPLGEALVVAIWSIEELDLLAEAQIGGDAWFAFLDQQKAMTLAEMVRAEEEGTVFVGSGIIETMGR